MSFWREFALFYISVAVLPLLLLLDVSFSYMMCAELCLWTPRIMVYLYKYYLYLCEVAVMNNHVNVIMGMEGIPNGDLPMHRTAQQNTGIMIYQPTRPMGPGIRGVYSEKYTCTVDIEDRLWCLQKLLVMKGVRIYWRRTWIGLNNTTRSVCAICKGVCRPHDSGYSPFLVTDYMHEDCAMRRVLGPFIYTRYMLLTCLVPVAVDVAAYCVPLWATLCYDPAMNDLNPVV